MSEERIIDSRVSHVHPSYPQIYFIAYSHNSVYILVTIKKKNYREREREREREDEREVGSDDKCCVM